MLWSALGRSTWVRKRERERERERNPKDLSSWDLLLVLWSALGRSTWVSPHYLY